MDAFNPVVIQGLESCLALCFDNFVTGACLFTILLNLFKKLKTICLDQLHDFWGYNPSQLQRSVENLEKSCILAVYPLYLSFAALIIQNWKKGVIADVRDDVTTEKSLVRVV